MSHEPVPENLESEWNAAVAADATLIHAISRLQAAPGLAPLLSRKLLSVRTCGDAVRLLARLDSQHLIQLLPEVVRLALTSHRDALRTRELIGRLPHEEIKKAYSTDRGEPLAGG